MFLLAVGLAALFCAVKSDDICYSLNKNHSISCVTLDQCKPVQDVLQIDNELLDVSVIALLRSLQCGFNGSTPKVWCATPSSKSKFPDVDNHKNVNLLPKKCGYIAPDEKIHNGNKTGILDYPWMALMFYPTEQGPQVICGGTIINNKYILTAAHCAAFRHEGLSIRIGEHNLETPIDCELVRDQEYCAPQYQDLPILEVIVHPGYNNPKFANDIALIRVPEIDFSIENTQPICLPLENARNHNFISHPTAVVTGWGLTEKRISSRYLLQAALSVVDLDKCKETFKNLLSVTITDRQICAANIASDSCNGDSGGPLQVVSSHMDDVRIVQQGVVSFGPTSCNNPNYPGVYTRVASYMDWILDTIEP